ncbi:MAG: hypothetical protein D6826_11540 [Alphaproteobacteria bacterium]|nr:MAG: hypothetical protein D6826_11540 [Alphaproteobacteria bacterium]
MTAYWIEADAALDVPVPAADTRLHIGDRFSHVDLPYVVWRVTRVYRDAQGIEHAILMCEARPLDPKTLSAPVLLDAGRYRRI